MDGSTDSAQGSMKMSAEEQTARECERYASVRQYSLARILAVWAAAAIPMAVLAWAVAPLLGVLLGGDDVTFIKVLLLCILAGLIWQFVLVMPLVHQERRSLRWSVLKDVGLVRCHRRLVRVQHGPRRGAAVPRPALLPQMKGAFGRWDWVANGILFAVYHLHEPWLILSSLVDTFALSYPSRRYRSARIGIIVHSSQSIVFGALVLLLVIR